MSALARNNITDSETRAANDDCINGGSCNRTKYTYDANGNALTRPGYSTMTWSSYNYPTSISTGYGPGWTTSETVGFAYGPNRQRWQQTYSGNNTTETTDYVGRLLQFVSSGGTLDYRHYIYGGTGAVAVYSRKSTGVNTFSYLLSDNQSSVASITNSSGAQVAGESFTAFGNRRNPTTWSGADTNSDLTTIAGITREGYTFQTALGLWSGLNHMKGRVEDAWSGRMLSADPTIPDPTSTQSYNRYSYVNNNPVTYSDPTGFDPDCDQCVKDDGSGGPLDEVTITASRESDSDPNATLGLTGSVAPSGGTSTSDPDKPKLEEVTVNGSRITPGKVPLVPILPQVSQQKAGCPSGLMGSIANQMNLWGKAAQKAGNLITNIGGTIVAAGAVGTFTAGPEIGLPVIGLGGTVAGIGSITTYTGIGIQAASGLITTAYGNNQPGVNATAQAAAAVVESLIDQKLGFPLTSIPGLTDPIDALVHRVSGVNPCPQ